MVSVCLLSYMFDVTGMCLPVCVCVCVCVCVFPVLSTNTAIRKVDVGAE